ncbi:MAG: tRNA glutamyl-Q(34) synthetase GluQRS [Rhodocyclales bacterium GT-UBC]|nr:MAG: tRNA glutamyl-Q(34) synthetase GluQRS [Rhodocyclales bacterium GT-UBC]
MIRSRFAPSPSGALHFGSLVAALGSYLDARSRQGEWLVRIEDVDLGRTVPGAADDILATLEAFGFTWDGPVVWQSQRLDRYAEVLDALRRDGLAYGCACSRKEIADAARLLAVDGGPVYPGICRSGLASGRAVRAWRMRVPDEALSFEDRVQGTVDQVLARDVGDFVLQRADGYFAYQLAVVIDDADQGISDVVRGADLLDSTPRQIWLQRCLGYATPRYAHLPVVSNAAGEKLSKQTRAPALDVSQASAHLVDALDFLGQVPPAELARAGIGEVWAWALANWRFDAIPRVRAMVRS